MKTYTDVYYKQGGYVSGFELSPIVSETLFMHCVFHPNIRDVIFKQCVFEFCEGQENIIHKDNCIVLEGKK